MGGSTRRRRLAAVIVALVVLMVAVEGAAARDMMVLTPYLGAITNSYENEAQDIDLEDTGLFGGLVFQWIDPQRFQLNTFVYHAPNVTYSTIWGGHFIFDYYFGVQDAGKWVAGAGLEIIRLDMDAGDAIDGLEDFTLLNTIYVPFVRGGRYFYLDLAPVRLSVLPWVGFEPELVRGELSFDLPFPPMSVKEDIETNELFAIAGINVTATFFHFIEIQAKYKASLGGDDYLNTVSAMANILFTPFLGVSYRMKYFETTAGSNLYHLGGVSVVF